MERSVTDYSHKIQQIEFKRSGSQNAVYFLQRQKHEIRLMKEPCARTNISFHVEENFVRDFDVVTNWYCPWWTFNLIRYRAVLTRGEVKEGP